MDWMNQNANAGGYDPNTAPVNLTPATSRAFGALADLGGVPGAVNQFQTGMRGIPGAPSLTPAYDYAVRGPEGVPNTPQQPGIAQKLGASVSDILTLPFRAAKGLGHAIDPVEVGPVQSYTPYYDVVRGTQTANAAAAAAPAATSAPAGGIDFSKFQTLKTKAVPLEQALPQPKAAPVAATPQNIPNGALMEMAKIANTRKIIGARDHILGAVYGWHQASYMDAYKKLQANPNDKDAQAQMQKAREGATALVSGTALGQQAMFGAQQQDVQ